jgi:hypothetical protein
MTIRRDLGHRLHELAGQFPAVTLTGPRQSGKSTLLSDDIPAACVYHYRDQNGVEADLIIEHSDRLTLVEAKAAQTANSGLLDGVRRVRDVLQRVRPCEAVVAYGGETEQKRSDAVLAPGLALHKRQWV